MNGDLIDIIEILIHRVDTYKGLYIDLEITHLCIGCECNECLLNTSKRYLSDYPNFLVQIKDITHE